MLAGKFVNTVIVAFLQVLKAGLLTTSSPMKHLILYDLLCCAKNYSIADG